MKNLIFRGPGFTKIQYRGGDCLKWGLGQFAGLRGLGKKAGSVFEGGRRGWWRGGGDASMHTVSTFFTSIKAIWYLQI